MPSYQAVNLPPPCWPTLSCPKLTPVFWHFEISNRASWQTTEPTKENFSFHVLKMDWMCLDVLPHWTAVNNWIRKAAQKRLLIWHQILNRNLLYFTLLVFPCTEQPFFTQQPENNLHSLVSLPPNNFIISAHFLLQNFLAAQKLLSREVAAWPNTQLDCLLSEWIWWAQWPQKTAKQVKITLAQSRSWLKKCCGEGGHTTLLNIVFLMWYISQSSQKWVHENTCSFWRLPFTHILFKYSLMFKGVSHKTPEEILDYSKQLRIWIRGQQEFLELRRPRNCNHKNKRAKKMAWSHTAKAGKMSTSCS